MANHSLFLSYKRGPVVTPMAQRFHDRTRVQLAGVETFFDRRSIDAGDEWNPAIDDFLAKATLFVAFISIDYWLSEQCRRELFGAIARYETQRAPRLLFVLADRLDPNDLAIDPVQASGRLEEMEAAQVPVGRVRSVGQINFLGPYDAAGRLVRLEHEDFSRYDDQLAGLIASTKKVLKGLES